MSTEANFTTWMAAQADDLRRERDALRAQLAESEASNICLAQWKCEALPVMDGLQELGGALDLPLGAHITGPMALAEVRKRSAQLAEAQEQVRRVLELADAAEDAQRRRGKASLVARAIRNAVEGKVTRFTSDDGGDAA